MRERYLNFEKNIKISYVNKDGCRKFISAHRKVQVS